MKPSSLLVILLFCLVLRGAFVAIFSRTYDPYYVELAGQTLLNVSLLVFCCYQFRLRKEDLAELLGTFQFRMLAIGAGLGILFLMFLFGESALTTWAIAQFDKPLAFRVGSFHDDYYPAASFFSVHVFSYLAAAVLLPAIVEEIFFRGFLFVTIAKKYSIYKSAMICAALFVALHTNKSVQINTFLFAFVLCIVYVRTESLYAAIVAHATYNFLAFVTSYYVDIHRLRSMEQIASLSNWTLQIWLISIATFFFAKSCYTHRIFLRSLLRSKM